MSGPQECYRVWPDGTVQAVEDGPPHTHMSDDFQLVWATDEEHALRVATRGDPFAPVQGILD